MLDKQTIGKLGEDLALKFLKNKGFLMISRNFRVRGGEIDLVCQKAGQLHFIEVKTRTNLAFGYGEESVNYFKRRRLKTAILEYLSRNNVKQQWQIDVIVIELNVVAKKAKVRYYEAVEL
ncbi:MAG: YraN family protein [Candidatus Komeilibacteria bacterium]|nr:YraN family protein [Candidatus Komeilibacteria bacterium]